MSDITLIVVLMAVGAALLLAELFLPAHGVIGVLGVIAVVAAIWRTFLLNEWAGVGLALAAAGAVPFAWAATIKYWPRTPMGRKMLLGPVVNVPEAPAVRIGQRGVTVSGMRPVGVCEFDGRRVEAITEIGMLEAQTPVIVTAIHNRRPTVRAAESERTT